MLQTCCVFYLMSNNGQYYNYYQKAGSSMSDLFAFWRAFVTFDFPDFYFSSFDHGDLIIAKNIHCFNLLSRWYVRN